MKAAVLHALGTVPAYETFPDPTPRSEAELLLTVTAAAVKNLDKGRASGTHYASHRELPAVVGIDGVGRLADGTRVYAQGLTGMLAEKALIAADSYTVLPAGLDEATAAALPNAVVGAALALRFRAQLRPGEVVLINGATGVTGLLAVQLARYYGAATIIATGRNPAALTQARALGADVVVSLQQPEADLLAQLRRIHAATPLDVVLDYLWGRPVELLLAALQGEGLHAPTRRVRLVTAGSMAGEEIKLTSKSLRSAATEVLGSGFGSLSPAELKLFSHEVLPEMFALAATGRLHIATTTTDLTHIAAAWTQDVPAGVRLVVRI